MLVAVALVGGITARTLEAVRANREAARASQEAARANREAEAARQVSDFLVGLFEVSDPDKAASGAMNQRSECDPACLSPCCSSPAPFPWLSSPEATGCRLLSR